MDLSKRAYLSEWMDEPCSYQDFRACLADLAQVNRITFSYRPTLQWLQSIAPSGPGRPIHIVDVGCGGGDMLRHIERWARRAKLPVQLTGIDLNPYAARAAREMTPADSAIEWITGDAFSCQTREPVDVIVSSLFTHHLPDHEIVRFLQWMERVAAVGWFVNDLHRERLPFYGFQLLARIMRWHRFVQHDGPISFRRAFQPSDWTAYLADAAIPAGEVLIQTVRPARLCLARVKSS